MNQLEQIAEINRICFGVKDAYSKYEYLKKLKKRKEFGYFIAKDNNKIIGYLMYWRYDDCFEGLRSGVLPEYQSRGIGKKLYKRMFKLVESSQLPYWTYSSAYNYKSVSSHIRAGMVMNKIREDEEGLWVDLIFRPKKKGG